MDYKNMAERAFNGLVLEKDLQKRRLKLFSLEEGMKELGIGGEIFDKVALASSLERKPPRFKIGRFWRR